ncbi:hypothetical protein M9H77_34200 [Catharanthus roseus]|uniref:Uncharacterized protein n=1 Tax=Catharanthus roseus TaxID=4058 RepID=A0ACB9ZL93_CATRO|nr:hypothetical protein M9H77_34200 [Catharanthus roseus]
MGFYDFKSCLPQSTYENHIRKQNFTSQSILSLPEEGPAFCTCSRGPGALCTCPLHSIEYGNSNLNLVQLDFPFVPPNTLHFCYIGFINGLSCWSLHPMDKIALWNPSIRKFKVLPIDAPSLSSFGFGYDESSDDYKIIILTNYAKNGVPRMEVEIYSSKKKCSYKIDDYLDGDISSFWHENITAYALDFPESKVRKGTLLVSF